MKRVLMYMLTAGVLGGCASSGETPRGPVDPIVVPEAAVPVADMTLVRSEVWTPINRRMLLAQAGTKYFLITFEDSCPPLSHTSPQVWLSTYGTSALHSNDVLRVDDALCPVNDIYTILEEDWIALKTRARR